MDSKISKARSSRQNSYPPQKLDVRGVQDERVVDKRDEYPGRSHTYSRSGLTKKQRGRGRADIQRRHESSPAERVSRIGGISVGRSFWADGYFAETVGQVNEEIVKRYIRRQAKP